MLLCSEAIENKKCWQIMNIIYHKWIHLEYSEGNANTDINSFDFVFRFSFLSFRFSCETHSFHKRLSYISGYLIFLIEFNNWWSEKKAKTWKLQWFGVEDVLNTVSQFIFASRIKETTFKLLYRYTMFQLTELVS